jgi:hypothetical protein
VDELEEDAEQLKAVSAQEVKEAKARCVFRAFSW